MTPLVLIPARMASTRLPGKPLADICGKPMIAHVLARAQEADLGPVVVACDDETVYEVVSDYGGQAVMTVADLPSGSDRIFAALEQVDPAKKYDTIINLQGDLPTIDPQTIRLILTPLAACKETDISTLACPFEKREDLQNPHMVKACLPEGVCPVFMEDVVQALDFSRQEKPSYSLYHHIGLYGYRRAALEKFVRIAPSAREKQEKLEQLRALDSGMRFDLCVVPKAPAGVDTAAELEQARQKLAELKSPEAG